MNDPLNKRAVGVGVFILVGLLFLVGGIMTIGNLHSTFQKKMTISSVFANVNGLQSGNNIWFSGVKVGVVKKTEFSGERNVKVQMNINTESRQYIRKDAKVKISTDGFIGNKILVIYGGTAEAGEIQNGDTLTNETMLTTEDIMTTFQQNNLNVLKFTQQLASGNGTISKLLNSDSVYNNIATTTLSLKKASANAEKLIASLANFGAKLNNKGTLANELTTDTAIFKSFKASVLRLGSIADTAKVFINTLKEASKNPKSPVGVMIHDEQSGAELKTTISNLESSSKKLDADLEALQHSFLLKRFFKNKSTDK
jgi:phospholipid/cholesterol/gamma-HCH transport system substrate-binding protein